MSPEVVSSPASATRTSRSSERLVRFLLVIFVLWLIVRLGRLSLMGAYYGDEAVSLLAAQLINAGRRLYFDFLCQHPPLYFHLLARWMRIFGQTWQSAHLFSVAATGGACTLVGFYLRDRTSRGSLGVAATLAALAAIAFNPWIESFGTVAQYYGLLLLLSFAAFWLTVDAIRRPAWRCLLGGVAAGLALSTTFLAIPVVAVLFVWTVVHSPRVARVPRGLWFSAGVVLPLVPIIAMAIRGPQYVLYNLFVYHLFYRAATAPGADVASWTLNQISAWFHFPADVVVAAAAGLSLLAPLDARTRAEHRLCIWLALSTMGFGALTRPAMAQYFILFIPFGATAAALAVGSLQLSRINLSPIWMGTAVVSIISLWSVRISLRGPAPSERNVWNEIMAVSDTINRVTDTTAPLYASEEVFYFTTGRLPPPGLENWAARSRIAPGPQDQWLHFTPASVIRDRFAAGSYAAAVIRPGDEFQEVANSLYRHREASRRFILFWNDRHPHTGKSHE